MSATAILAGGELRYSTVWEDHLLLEGALRVHSASRLLVIASAGCNVLNLLLRAPRRIVAIDVNPAQTALLELKLAALQTLGHDGFLALLGARPHGARTDLYERVRGLMSAPARDWCDANVAIIEAGIAGAGRLDRFFAEFRREHLSSRERRDVAAALFEPRPLAEQAAYARERLFTPEFEAGFRAHFTREALGGRGRDPSQFAYVSDADVPEWFLGRLRWVCTALPARDNHYLRRFLLGPAHDGDCVAPHLRRERYERLAALASRVEVVTDSIDAYLDSSAAGAIDGAALSNLFEYLAPGDSDALFARLGRTLAAGARVAYWNLLVPRRSPNDVRALRHLDALSLALWKRDRAWFYQSFNVEEVIA
jgi:S-adenosylmethionine-diacylglycerol 3-amino-3-carboxypropyl transferase